MGRLAGLGSQQALLEALGRRLPCSQRREEAALALLGNLAQAAGPCLQVPPRGPAVSGVSQR